MNGNVPICTFCAGAVKPNVVFFGEDLPEKYFQHAEDFPKADLLMIMGTSLKSTVPRLLLNRDPVGPFEWRPLRSGDYIILGWHTEIQDLMNSHENGLCSFTDPNKQPCLIRQ
uniref:Si:dkey-103i16.6 n=1 Tax=Sinocyclocheilus grahami TaxID=75366 RepID=A0A672R354_SINGR